MTSSLPKIWRPFTIQEGADQPIRIQSGSGLWLELESGTKVMDLISSWWVNLHGHAHPHIASAISRQAQTLEHVIFAGFTHSPAEEFAERLLVATDHHFGHVFFSDNGSTAVEVALKISLQYWVNQGQTKRKRFLAFEGAYHGDTLGAMSAGDRSVFTEVFNDWLLSFHRIPYPQTWIGDEECLQKEIRILSQIQTLLDTYPNEFAGVIIEPLIQGAGGMRMCRPEFLQQLEILLRQHDVLVIYDEVMTGFGRTGELFAFQKAGTSPDLICLSKGITGGFMPMSVTLTTTQVFEPFYATDPLKTLWHGHSYTGNPLGCAAANASLDLMPASSRVFREMEQWHLDGLYNLAKLSAVDKLRVCGTVAAVSIRTKGTEGYLNSISGVLKKRFLQEGMLIRPLGNELYFMPPYCITRLELETVYYKACQILSELK